MPEDPLAQEQEEAEKETGSVFAEAAEPEPVAEQSELPPSEPEVEPEAEVLEPEPQVTSESEAQEVVEELVQEEKVIEVPVQEEEVVEVPVQEEEVVKQEEVKVEGKVEEQQQGESLQASSVPESVLADIEAQVIPPEVAAEGEQSQVFPPEVDVEIEAPSPSIGGDPTPVEEVVPDPIHIEPLQDPVQKSAGEEQPPTYEKADITSDLDNTIREELDEAEELQARVSVG